MLPLLFISLSLSTASGVNVHCQPLPPYLAGEAIVQTREIVLNTNTCAGFYEDTTNTLESLITLGHETAHLHGISNEKAADCMGLAEAPWLAKRLHIRLRKKWLRRYGPVC